MRPEEPEDTQAGDNYTRAAIRSSGLIVDDPECHREQESSDFWWMAPDGVVIIACSLECIERLAQARGHDIKTR